MRASSGAHRLSGMCGIMLGAMLGAGPGAATTIAVPPVTIYQLDHTNRANGGVTDAITIPGTGYTASLFGATIATGDLVTVRVEAPPGKKFVMHAPGQLWFVLYWHAFGGTASSEYPNVVTFENLQGPMPSQNYSFTTLGDQRHIIEVWKNYDVAAPFEFTAARFDITVSLPFPTVDRDYTFFGSFSAPSIGASGMPLTPGAPILEIVDLPTPIRTASWAGVKTRYR